MSEYDSKKLVDNIAQTGEAEPIIKWYQILGVNETNAKVLTIPV